MCCAQLTRGPQIIIYWVCVCVCVTVTHTHEFTLLSKWFKITQLFLVVLLKHFPLFVHILIFYGQNITSQYWFHWLGVSLVCRHGSKLERNAFRPLTLTLTATRLLMHPNLYDSETDSSAVLGQRQYSSWITRTAGQSATLPNLPRLPMLKLTQR